MLNFNRFKYRRKACLDFHSPGRSQNSCREEERQIKPKDDETRDKDATGLEHKNDEWPKNGGYGCKKSKEPSKGRKYSTGDETDVSLDSDHKKSSYDSKKKNYHRYFDSKKESSEVAASVSCLKDDRKLMTGEDRLSNILCNGIPSRDISSRKDVAKHDYNGVNRKRKEPNKESPQKVTLGASVNKKIEQPSHNSQTMNGSKPLDSYEIFKPKSKRKKVILLENSSDEDSDIGRTVTKEAELSSNDISKLREIYSHLSISEAKEAIDSAGSLVDAILSLADSLNIEDGSDKDELKKEEKKIRKKKMKHKRVRRVIIDDDDDDDGHDGNAGSYLKKSPKKALSPGQSSEECLVLSNNGECDDAGSSNGDEYEDMTEDQALIHSFFEEASLADIATVPGCSEKKASEIIKYRPFKNYNDLVIKVSHIKGVSTKLIEDSIDFINEQAKIDKLLVKCQRISKNISKAILMQPERRKGEKQSDIDSDDHRLFMKQPSILNSSLELKHYQLLGLNWLITLHKEGVNGILADQMGLGKTIQALAFLGYLIENGNTGPHVIIVPSSTCDNWLREIQTWLPTVRYVQYKGSQEERFALREDILYGEEDFNIIISTYNIAISTAKDRSLFRRMTSSYLVLDEGHMLKNMKSNRYKHLMEIKSERRLLLTGTPLQNNLLEMISLLSFLMPEFFAERINGISMLFGSKSQSSYQGRIIETAKKILKPFILRRTKKDVLKDLPKKVEKLLYCDLTQKQRVYYDALVTKYKTLDGSRENYKSAVTIVMQLRKTSNHPLLERNLFGNDILRKMAKDYCDQLENRECCFENVLEDMEVMSDFELHNLCREKYYLTKYSLQTEAVLNSGKFKQLDQLLPDLKEKGCRVLFFSQFTTVLDIAEPYLKHRKYKYLRLDGQTPVADRQSLIDKYNSNEEFFIFLLSTRAGGVGINLTAANVVIMHDIDFNPYNDKQAEDRCHRVGQRRDVTVYKLISKDTIEEGILKCANSKLNLEQHVAGNFEEDDSASEDVLKYLMANIS